MRDARRGVGSGGLFTLVGEEGDGVERGGVRYWVEWRGEVQEERRGLLQVPRRDHVIGGIAVGYGEFPK